MSDLPQDVPTIAIVGMAGRFPGASDLDEFWRNLRSGEESITFFSRQELEEVGFEASMLDHPDFVPAFGSVEDIDLFDAAFFDFNPRDAELTDPQHRWFLEIAWHALEDAGLVPDRYPGLIGVYASTTFNTYLTRNLRGHPLPGAQVYYSNDKDFMATRASYKLDLKGPSVNVQTACSSSLVATCMACQALLDYQCDTALAGGASLAVPHRLGYVYQEGGIASPDGHCRAFDAAAAGSVGGCGAGVVVLKRLEDAVADGDRIRAVISGVGLNNDGSSKPGFSAPSVRGQAEAIAMAQAMAQVGPETVDYVETHGTGTRLGDSVEIAALAKAFGDGDGRTLLGAVKTNIGHLDVAAGIAGLIKTALAIEHGEIPPTLHFVTPNSDLEKSPRFGVAADLTPWPRRRHPRRAGVSSFGIGGTNAHVVVEQAPEPEPSGPSRRWQLLAFSAKSDGSLESLTDDLGQHLETTGDSLADIAYSLRHGRKSFEHRRILVCRDAADAASALSQRDPRLLTLRRDAGARPLTFLFPGQGAQYAGMGRGLYSTEPTFRRWIDTATESLTPRLDVDLRQLLLAEGDALESAHRQLEQTALAQPALFVVEHALARLWIEWGATPQAMLGHSIGEYVAATLAGVFSLDDALALVAARGRLMQSCPEGSMLSVPLPAEEVSELLGDELDLAAVNAPSSCVLSGPAEAIEALAATLAERNIEARRLHTSHAFHSAMMDEILDDFAAELRRVSLKPPRIPFLSNVTGTWITAGEAQDPDYWCRHLRRTVRFADGLAELWKEPERIFLEVGPGRTMTSLASQQAPSPPAVGTLVRSLPTAKESTDESELLLTELGKLWLAGIELDDAGFYRHESRRRVSLPAYPFDRQRYWIDPLAGSGDAAAVSRDAAERLELDDWFHLPCWQRAPRPAEGPEPPVGDAGWLVFADRRGIGEAVARRLRERGWRAVIARPGDGFARIDTDEFRLDPRRLEDYEALLRDLASGGALPHRLAHCWSLDAPEAATSAAESFRHQQDVGFYSLLRLAQALASSTVTQPVQLEVVSVGLFEVTASETLLPERVTVLGPARVIPQELPNVACRTVDLEVPEAADHDSLAERLIAELAAPAPALATVAYRGGRRWVQKFLPWPLAEPSAEEVPLRRGGVYLITGGLGHVGRDLARYLITELDARVVLTGRSATAEDAEGAGLAEASADAPGAAVYAADVADVEGVTRVVQEVRQRFGDLHGVFHAAGVLEPEAFGSIQQLEPAVCEQHFGAKVHGLYALEQALEGQPLDFCLLFSSTSSVLGGLGFLAYAASNQFMDAYAHQHNRRSEVPWISACWDPWQRTVASAADDLPDELGSSLKGLAMTPEEGIEALRRVLALNDVSQVVVSLGDLDRRIEQWSRPGPSADSPETAKATGKRHDRPELGTPYLAPRNEIETALAEIWSELLGIEPIGVHDDFFALGGHSLLGVQVVSRLREKFRVDLPVGQLFEQPTIAALGTQVVEQRAEEVEEDQLADALDRLEELSEDEIARLLAEAAGESDD